MVKVAKDLLSIYLKRPDYFFTGKDIKLTQDTQLHCLKTLHTLFLMLERLRLQRLLARMTELKAAGKTNYEILMFETSDEIQEFAYSHGERLTIANCLLGLEKVEASRGVLREYFLLFAWEVMLREMGLLLLEGWICP